MRTVARSSSLRTAQGGIFLLDVLSENIPSWHGLCLSCMVIALCRDIAVVLITSVAIWIFDNFIGIFIVKLETGDSQDLKYGVDRFIGSGATVQSVSRCLLVVKMAVLLFHDGMRKLQRWNHLISE